MMHERVGGTLRGWVRSLLGSSALAAGCALTGTAFAQSEEAVDPKGLALEEVIVTAQFRQESMQDTPLAITAVTGDMLEARGIETTRDLVAVAPNVSITSNAAIFGPSIGVFMRGVGQYDANFAYEPGVGVYLDDIYYGLITGADFSLADIDRVEILRGPQGTLSGKNSEGGSIKLYGRKPQGDDSGYVEATFGRFDRTDLRGALDVGLTEELALRVSGFSNNKDGYVKRVDFACANPSLAGNIPRIGTTSDCEIGREGGVDSSGVRAAFRYTPNDSLEVNLVADQTDDRSGPAPSTLFYVLRPPVGGPTNYFYGGNPATGTPYDHRFVPADRYTTYATFRDELSGTDLGSRAFNKHWGVMGDVEWSITEGLRLRSISGYRELEALATFDGDASPIGGTTTLVHNDYRQFTQELRLSGASSLLDWTVGGFYFDSTGVNQSVVDSGISLTTDDLVTITSKSAFGHLVVHLGESLNLTGGIRYTDDEKTYDFTHYRLDGSIPRNPNGTLNCSGVPGAGGDPLNCLPLQVSTDDRIDYRLGVDYRLSDAVMVYAQFSTGYRGSGVNPKPFTAGQAVNYDQESIDAYEAGIKTDLLDRRLRLNLTGFYSKYKDIVLINSAGFCVPPETPANSFCFQSAVPFNAGNADIQGIELEAEFRPGGGLSLSASASYLDFEYTALAPAAINSRITYDDYPPLTPEWKASGSVAYAFDLGNGGTVTPRFDVEYQSEVYAEAPNNGFYPPGLPQNPNTAGVNPFLIPDRTLANARLTYDSPEEKWQASLAVTNLTDKYYYTNAFSFYFSGYGTRSVAPPREWAVSIRRRF